jgi:glutamyl-Q tRNA(Asp) synthetase
MSVTRFAPSPTGFLHLGHAYSALFARDQAGKNGVMRLRIEDIDQSRCRPAYVDAIFEDLSWLGLEWPEQVRVQSQHFAAYQVALERLHALGVLYPCFCTRRQIAESVAAPHGPTIPYPGTCRALGPNQRADRIAAGEAHAWRLDGARALAITGPLAWRDLSLGEIAADPLSQGDVILARKDFPASYHLTVTWDDAAEGIDLITRGRDLIEATHIHRLLQALLGLPVPVWHHHRLILDEHGDRLAKRHNAPTIRELRAEGATVAEIKRRFVDRSADERP